MAEVQLKWAEAAPDTEYNKDFIQAMLNRMAMAFFSYGAVRDKYPNSADALASLEKRLAKYRETGNTEWLIDAANFCMIEFMYPSHPKAHFRATERDESPRLEWK